MKVTHIVFNGKHEVLTDTGKVYSGKSGESFQQLFKRIIDEEGPVEIARIITENTHKGNETDYLKQRLEKATPLETELIRAVLESRGQLEKKTSKPATGSPTDEVSKGNIGRKCTLSLQGSEQMVEGEIVSVQDRKGKLYYRIKAKDGKIYRRRPGSSNFEML